MYWCCAVDTMNGSIRNEVQATKGISVLIVLQKRLSPLFRFIPIEINEKRGKNRACNASVR